MPLFLAWVDAFATVFDPMTHGVIDDAVVSAEISHAEGEFARARLIYKNPGVGLLNPARPKVALISWADGADTPALIFRGRIVGVPLGLRGAEITIELSAEPPDAEAQLLEMAFGDPEDPDDKGLAVLPWYDPLFFDPLGDPDPADVLEARPAVWLWSATDGAVSLSNLIEGGSGIVDLGYDYEVETFDLQVGDPPLTRVDVQLNIEWEQRCRNAASIGRELFRTAGYPFKTLTPGEFFANWPAEGESIGSNSGWVVTASNPNYQGDEVTAAFPIRRYRVTVPPQSGSGPGVVRTVVERKQMLRSIFAPSMRVACDYRQPRREVLTVAVTLAQQAIFGSDARLEKLELDADDITIDRVTPDWEPNTEYEVDDLVQAQGRVQRCTHDHTSGPSFSPWQDPQDNVGPAETIWEVEPETRAPIGRAYRPSYIEQADTDAVVPNPFDPPPPDMSAVDSRARHTISHAVLRARAMLLSRLRCIQISATALWGDLAGLTLDHDIRLQSLGITDPIVGKVVAYTKRWNEPAGQRGVDFTIACCPGTGEPQPVPGDGVDRWADDYADDWATKTEWAPEAGVVISLGDENGEFPPAKEPIKAERLSSPSYVVMSSRVENRASTQEAYVALAAANYALGGKVGTQFDTEPFDLIQPVEDVPTAFRFRLRNIGAWDTLERRIEARVETLVAPRQINLES